MIATEEPETQKGKPVADNYGLGGSKKGWVPPSELLKAMRHVFECAEAEDTDDRHRKCRELWNTDKFKFVERLTALERHHRETNERSQDKWYDRNVANGADEDPESPVPATETDECEQRILVLIELLKREMKV